MDTQNPLAVESFSCSWLPDSRPSLDNLDRELLRPLACSHQDFYFDVPSFSNPEYDAFAHADELFYNGVIRALLWDAPDSQTPPVDTRTVTRDGPRSCSLLRRWRKSFERTIWRCFGTFLVRLGNSRGRTRVDDIDRRNHEDKGSVGPKESSPSHDLHTEENSIYEAVLHCKRSIEKRHIPIDETTTTDGPMRFADIHRIRSIANDSRACDSVYSCNP